jgi:4-aminobutyrate aminotransferase/(S)-3-amino-2-methylpropionate transaminase
MTTSESTAMTVNDIPQERRLVTAIPGPKSLEIQKRRTSAVSAGVGATLPIFISKAAGGVVVDIDGNSLIDMGSGIAVTSVGNSAKQVVDRVIAQVQDFTHTCFMVTQYESYVEVCEALNRLTPGDHEKRSALFNTGAEAVENAVKIARVYTKRQAVVVFEHGYHGRTNLTMAMTAKVAPYKQGFGPFASEIYRMPLSYPAHDGLTGKEAADHAISRMIKEIGAENIAAIVIEPIQGEGGFIVPAQGFLPSLVKFSNDNGIVFVADEVQTGFGRTGKMFAVEHESVDADLITTAKGIAGGFPLAGVTGRAEMLDSVHASGLGGTFGGNPVACAAALGAIATIEEEKLVDRANVIGKIMVDALNTMAKKYSVIGEIRGAGAMQAIELIKPGSIEPNSEAMSAVIKYCQQKGVLILSAGTYSNVIRLLPPLVMPEHLLIEALGIIDEAFASL